MNKPSLNTLLQNFETEQVQRQLPDFGPGDTRSEEHTSELPVT